MLALVRSIGPNLARGRRPARRMSLVTESLATIGAILVLAGSGVSISQRWLVVTDWGRFAILASVAICFLVAGFGIRWLTASVTAPLTELMWCASAGCAAGAAAVVSAGAYRLPAAVTLLIVSGTAAVYSIALWLLCRREMLLVIALGGLVGVLLGAVPLIVTNASPWLAVGLGLWLLGLAWIALGWMYPEPLATSVGVGAALALLGPAVAVHGNSWVYAVAILTAAAVMAMSVPLRNVLLVAFGSCALLGYLAAVIWRYADRWFGVPESLVIIGLVLIGLAIFTVRLGRASNQGPRAV